MLRKPARQKAQRGGQVSATYPWPAPVKGWYDSESIADMPEGSAYVLDNWFPESTSIVIRPGFEQHARIVMVGELEANARVRYDDRRATAPHASWRSGGIATKFGAGGVTGG